MRTLITIILILFSITAKSQTVEEKMRLALKLQEENEYAKSNKHLIDLYSTNDMKDLVCLNLAKNYYKIGNCRLANKYASECMNFDSPYAVDAATIKGEILHMEGKFSEEESLYNTMLAKYSDNYELLLHKALVVNELRPSECGKQFYKCITQDPQNVKTHYLIANLEKGKRHYTQALLAMYFEMLTAPNYRCINNIEKIFKSRDIKDALQDVLYSADTIAGRTDRELFWAMAFISDLDKCEISDESQLPDAECFIDNSKLFMEKICQSVMPNMNNEETTYSDYYVDFFSKLLENNMFEEYMYYVLIGAYPDISDYISGMSKERINKFADFLEDYFK